MYIERYRQGDCVAVWEELNALGERVRREPFYSDALAVCRETMARVRRNVEVIAGRLTSLGYRLGEGVLHFPGACVPPASKDSARRRIAELQDRVPLLPMSLCAFWEIVGEVNFAGSHPKWPPRSDPLWGDSVEAGFDGFLRWQDNGFDGPMVVNISPDSIMKDGVSGSVYGITLPANGVDAPLSGLDVEGTVTFVEYLRKSLAWGGFPGLERVAHNLAEELQTLRQGLVPI